MVIVGWFLLILGLIIAFGSSGKGYGVLMLIIFGHLLWISGALTIWAVDWSLIDWIKSE